MINIRVNICIVYMYVYIVYNVYEMVYVFVYRPSNENKKYNTHSKDFLNDLVEYAILYV